MSQSFFVLVILEPTYSPIGIIAASAPSVKSPIPKMSITAPIRKERSIGASTGAIDIMRINTIALTGSTDASDSFIFSLSIVLPDAFNSVLLS